MDQKAVKDVIEYLLLVHKNMCYTVEFYFCRTESEWVEHQWKWDQCPFW